MNAVSGKFALHMGAEDRRRLERLARVLERTQSDVVRWLIRQACRELDAGIDTAVETPRRDMPPAATGHGEASYGKLR